MVESDGKQRVPGTVQVVARSPGCLRTRLNGYFDEAVCMEFLATIDEWRGTRTGVNIFHDITGVTAYDVAARDRVSRWTKAQVGLFASVHVRVERRSIAWALDIISMVSGMKMTTYHAAAAFEDAHKRISESG